jgi:general nucleoside transport system permease protein
MRFVLRGHEPRWLAPALVLGAVALTYALTAGPIRAAGSNPLAAYQRYVIDPLTSFSSFGEVLLASTPLVFTGLSVAIAFRCGFWNIGAEGQFIVGAIAATYLALTWPDLPSAVAIPLALVAGAVVGALWALVPGLLRTRYRIDEVVTTLLLNPVALLLLQGLLNGPWRNSTSGYPESRTFTAGYRFPHIIPGTRVDLGFAVALAIALALWVVLSHTAVGLRMRAVGLSPDASRFNGIAVERTLLRSALVSGAVAGLGGVSQVCGLRGQLTMEISAGFGYTGIVVATLAALTAAGVVLVAILLADVVVGSESAARVLQLPPQMGKVVTAVLLLTVVSLLVLRRYRLVLRRPRASRAPAPPTASDDDRRAVEPTSAGGAR